MNIKKLAVEFALAFAVTLAIVTGVGFLWNLIGHGLKIGDFAISFRGASCAVFCFATK